MALAKPAWAPGAHFEPRGRADLLVRLKTETASAHADIERAVDLAGRVSTIPGYMDLIARLYGFHATWEARAQPAIDDSRFFDARRKLPLLRAELSAFGMREREIDAIPTCTDLPPMPTQPHAFGAMYVVEGSTLGGAVIARHVERTLGFSIRDRGSYFRCYGSDLSRMWKEFGQRLLRLSSPQSDDVIVGSALRMFAAMRAWLSAP